MEKFSLSVGTTVFMHWNTSWRRTKTIQGIKWKTETVSRRYQLLPLLLTPAFMLLFLLRMLATKKKLKKKKKWSHVHLCLRTLLGVRVFSSSSSSGNSNSNAYSAASVATAVAFLILPTSFPASWFLCCPNAFLQLFVHPYVYGFVYVHVWMYNPYSTHSAPSMPNILPTQFSVHHSSFAVKSLPLSVFCTIGEYWMNSFIVFYVFAYKIREKWFSFVSVSHIRIFFKIEKVVPIVKCFKLLLL